MRILLFLLLTAFSDDIEAQKLTNKDFIDSEWFVDFQEDKLHCDTVDFIKITKCENWQDTMNLENIMFNYNQEKPIGRYHFGNKGKLAVEEHNGWRVSTFEGRYSWDFNEDYQELNLSFKEKRHVWISTKLHFRFGNRERTQNLKLISNHAVNKVHKYNSSDSSRIQFLVVTTVIKKRPKK